MHHKIGSIASKRSGSFFKSSTSFADCSSTLFDETIISNRAKSWLEFIRHPSWYFPFRVGCLESDHFKLSVRIKLEMKQVLSESIFKPVWDGFFPSIAKSAAAICQWSSH